MSNINKNRWEQIVTLTEEDLAEFCALELIELGYEVLQEEKFIYAAGEIPIMLVAHLDTVHREPPEIIFYSKDRNYCMANNGIGGDDRCGVYMILDIVKKLKCHVLFCHEEERGCVGARAFCRSDIKPQLNYIVEIDRKGGNDAVYYSCANEEFEEFIKEFEFEKATGTCSDISQIAPELKAAAVNISAGYYKQHTDGEMVCFGEMENNIKRIIKMISTPTEPFEYKEKVYSYGWNKGTFDENWVWDWRLKRYVRRAAGKKFGLNIKRKEEKTKERKEIEDDIENGSLADYFESYKICSLDSLTMGIVTITFVDEDDPMELYHYQLEEYGIDENYILYELSGAEAQIVGKISKISHFNYDDNILFKANLAKEFYNFDVDYEPTVPQPPDEEEETKENEKPIGLLPAGLQ